MNAGPTARHQMQNGEHSNQRPGDVDYGLNDIGPDDRSQSAFEGINQRQRGDDRNRSDFAGAERDRNHDGHGIDADPFGGSPGHEKQPGGHRAQAASEAAFDQFVSGVEVALKVLRQQNETNNDASSQISKDHLEKREIRIVSQARNTNDGERAGFRGNDRESDGPPGNIAIREKVIF